MRSATLALAAGLVVALGGGCGGDDGGGGSDAEEAKTFSFPGFEIEFDYPGDFKVGGRPRFNAQAGADSVDAKAVGLDDANFISVSKFELRVKVTRGNLRRIQPEADELFSRVAGRDLKSNPTTIAGRPALEYPVVDMTKPEGSQSRIVVVFVDDVEYEVNCQSTPKRRERMTDACTQMARTLKVAKPG